jgi:lipopolysaccharide biosynthesis regulator YciM
MNIEKSYETYCLGQNAYEKGEFEKALEYFYESLACNEHYKTYEKIYYCLKVLNKQLEARKYLELAYNLNKNNDKITVEYSQMLIDEGKKELSKTLLEGLLKRNPSYGPAKRALEVLTNLDKNME